MELNPRYVNITETRGIAVSKANRDLFGDVFVTLEEEGMESTSLSGTVEEMLAYGGIIADRVRDLQASEDAGA